jgi:uncharacterized protein (DUF305 family)
MTGRFDLFHCKQEPIVMTLFKTVAVLSIVAMGAAAPAVAQQAAPMPTPMPGMAMAPAATPAEGAMMSAMDRMSKDMAAVPMTGNADQDFVGMMIPHHQGAIDMARFELAHGKDPAMLKLARGVIAAQESEIRMMKAWQAKHPTGR